MTVLVLNSAQIEELLDLDDLRLAMGKALYDFSKGHAKNFPRVVAPVARGGLGFMAAALGEDGPLGFKAVSVFPGNTLRELNPHQGLVALLDPETGHVLSLQNGTALTAVRTAAVSAVATEILARPNAQHLALIGNGRQAYEHARALLRVRNIRRMSIFGRLMDKSRMLADKLRADFSGDFDFVSSPVEAVALADMMVTATAAVNPLLSTLSVNAGCHINAVGACRPGTRELDLQSRPELRVFVDSRTACAAEAEEITVALQQRELIPSDILSELGELVADPGSGRQHASDVTVFKSVGLGIQDVAAAQYFYRRAIDLNVGQRVEF